MQIIFGDHEQKIRDRFTVLELDTFQTADSSRPIQTWCVIETVPLAEIPMLEQLKILHQNLMAEYRKQNWQFCINALQHLQGKWNGEMDSFYDDLAARIMQYQSDPPGSDWNPNRLKN